MGPRLIPKHEIFYKILLKMGDTLSKVQILNLKNYNVNIRKCNIWGKPKANGIG